MSQRPPSTVESILERIQHRCHVLGNRTRSKKEPDMRKAQLAFAIRELTALERWIREGLDESQD